jgi:PST family polysaccharide transporter
LSTLAAIGALWWWGKGAVVAFVMAAPVCSFLLGHWYVLKLPRAIQMPGKRVDTSGEWRAMVRLGFAFMVAGLATTVGQLAIRTLLQRKLGIDALGQFQAAWMISMVYVGFVLGAMGTDYYPRLTAVIKDPGEVNRLVNEQTEIALLLAAPVLIAMLALSPWVVRVLYSSDFGDAAEILRWQVLGDILKVLSWPLGFVLLASGRGKTFICTEWLAMGLFFSLTYLLLPILLVAATGASFFAMYAVYLAAVWLLAVKQTAFAWSRNVKRYAVIVFIAGLALHALTEISSGLAAILGVIISATFGFVAVTKVSKMIRTRV